MFFLMLLRMEIISWPLHVTILPKNYSIPLFSGHCISHSSIYSVFKINMEERSVDSKNTSQFLFFAPCQCTVCIFTTCTRMLPHAHFVSFSRSASTAERCRDRVLWTPLLNLSNSTRTSETCGPQGAS